MKTESRFAFLSKEYVELHQYCINAENDCMLNPTRAVQVARNAIEYMVTRIVGRSNETLYNRMAKLKEITSSKTVPRTIWHYFNDVKQVGNAGAHAGSGNNAKVTTEKALEVVNKLVMITIWFYLKYEEKTCPKYCFAKQDYRIVMMFNDTIVADETELAEEATRTINEGYKYYSETPNPDYKKALELYKRAADLNNAKAEFNVGYMSFFGQGLEKPNYEEAIYYFTRAAEKGNGDADYYLARMYFNGEGVEQNCIRAVEYLKSGSTKDSTAAMCNLGVCYANGTGIDKDYDEAYRWWRNAAEKGNRNAIYQLGRYFQSVKNDEEKAILYYKQVAENTPEAALALGDIYEQSNKYTETEIFNMYLIAAKAGIVKAQYKVGYYYNRLSKNYDWSKEDEAIENMQQSVAWLQKASSQRCYEADFLLAQIYEEGLYVMRSLKKAYEYYKKAAEGENIDAMVKAGELCLKENPDGMTSLDWYMKAANKGNSIAQFKVGDYYFFAGNYDKAVYWYHQAADKDNEKATYCLAQCYHYGIGVYKNLNKALDILRNPNFKIQHPMEYLMLLDELGDENGESESDFYNDFALLADERFSYYDDFDREIRVQAGEK